MEMAKNYNLKTIADVKQNVYMKNSFKSNFSKIDKQLVIAKNSNEPEKSARSVVVCTSDFHPRVPGSIPGAVKL